jgi:hypothetical protein
MIKSGKDLVEFMKLEFLKRIYPTPMLGNGEDVAEVYHTYSWECIRKAAEALTDEELQEVFQFKKQFTFHNNSKSGQGSSGSDWTIKRFLQSHGSEEIKIKVNAHNSELKVERARMKREDESEEISTFMRLDHFAIKYPTPQSGAGGDVVEMKKTYSWSCILAAAEALNDEQFLSLKRYNASFSFHNNSFGHSSIGATWTIWYFLGYNGSSKIRVRLKNLKD